MKKELRYFDTTNTVKLRKFVEEGGVATNSTNDYYYELSQVQVSEEEEGETAWGIPTTYVLTRYSLDEPDEVEEEEFTSLKDAIWEMK